VDWQNRVEELFTLPGEQRCHAVVLASHNLAWFDRVAPAWTEQNLLPLASDSAVGDAFWDGIIWSGGNGLNERLLRALLPDLKRLARHPRGRRRDDAIVPGLILSSWGQSIGCSTSDQLVTDVELRDLLVLADQSFAHEVIRYLENWSRQDGPWGDRTIYFFECVWPKQRKLRTSATSARLTHLLFESGSLLPRLAPLIVPRPVPLRGGWVNYISRDESDSDPAKQYPAFVLDVMWVILADDPQDWPHGALQTLDVLETTPETASDTRLAELRRRQGI
jgi:hypothetical protein